jgi:hypothetical protein
VAAFRVPGSRLGATRATRGLFVDLAKIEHMYLHHAAATEAVVLNDAPISVFFAGPGVLGHSQEHAAVVYIMYVTARG